MKCAWSALVMVACGASPRSVDPPASGATPEISCIPASDLDAAEAVRGDPTGVTFCTGGDAGRRCWRRDLSSGGVTAARVEPARVAGSRSCIASQCFDDALDVDAARGLVLHKAEDGLGLIVRDPDGKVLHELEPPVEPTLARFTRAGKILAIDSPPAPVANGVFVELDGTAIETVGGEPAGDADPLNFYASTGQNPLELADGRLVFLDTDSELVAVHDASGRLLRRIDTAGPEQPSREPQSGFDSMVALPGDRIAIVRGSTRMGATAVVDLASGGVAYQRSVRCRRAREP